MVVSQWEKSVWQICMHDWTVHAKVEFTRFPPDVWGVHSTTVDPELRNERFTLIFFMGFPAILSTLQPFQICIFNRKYSKLTFSNGRHVMEKRFMANLHAWLDSTWKSRISKICTRCQTLGVHSTTLGPELRNERFILISFMGFLQINVNLSFLSSGSTVVEWTPQTSGGNLVNSTFACTVQSYMQICHKHFPHQLRAISKC